MAIGKKKQKVLREREYQIMRLSLSGSTLERIAGWYAFGEERIKLTENENEIRKRWQMAFDLLCEGYTDRDVVTRMMHIKGLSDAQGYRDLRNAKKLFGDVHKNLRDGERYILYRMAQKVFRMAMEDKDIRGMNSAITNMIKIQGLDRDDPNRIDPEDLQSHNYWMVFVKGRKRLKLSMSTIEDMPEAERKRIADFLEEDITDVEAEEILGK